MNVQAKPVAIDIAKRVEQYVKLRDKIKELEDKFDEQIKPYKDMLEQLNSLLLDHLNTTNQDSAKTAAGTVYRSERVTASLADAAAFRRFVIGGEHWDLADWKANSTTVQAFNTEHGALPPGVNLNRAYKVGVRRS
jgi:hypothetical protein